jgi:hypothetical protein
MSIRPLQALFTFSTDNFLNWLCLQLLKSRWILIKHMERDDFRGFPTEAEAMDLIDPGRRPYTLVRELFAEEGTQQNRLTTLSIRALHNAQTAGTLDPPLTDELADAVDRVNSFIDEHGDPFQTFKYPVARVVLSAVFEHGYRA